MVLEQIFSFQLIIDNTCTYRLLRKEDEVKKCEMIREWVIEATNFDGEPRKMLIPLQGCVSCKDYAECVSIVKSAFIIDELSDSLKFE